MIKKNLLQVVVSLSAFALVIGCSSTESPVSISEDNASTSADLVGNSPYTDDIATAGTSILWVLSQNTVSGRSDRYLYKYSSGTWTNTGHWGKAHTVSPSGRDYHINTDQGIWWGDGNGNFGNLANSTDLVSVSDITVCRLYSGCDQVWVLGKTSNGTTRVRRCNINTNDNSYSWDMSNPVYMPSVSGYKVWKIVRDPCNSSYAAVVLKGYNGHKYLYATSNSGYSWSQQNTTIGGIEDVAIRDLKVVFTYPTIDYSWICRGTVNGSYNDHRQIMTPRTCAINKSGSSYYVYILDGNYKVDRYPY